METQPFVERNFYLNKIPKWNCPKCNNQSLSIDKEKFFFEETIDSINSHSEDYWEFQFIQFYFIGLLTCSICNQKISFLGNGNLDYSNYHNQFTNEYFEEYNEIFTPTFFNPSLHLFKIKDAIPKQIRDELVASFSLFWNDLASCANKIRSTIELLLTDLKIKKTKIIKGKRKILPLHERIVNYSKINPELGKYLLAIKWIGNSGSHSAEAISEIAITDAFKLIEFSLNAIYSNRTGELNKIAKEIIRRKGVRKN